MKKIYFILFSFLFALSFTLINNAFAQSPQPPESESISDGECVAMMGFIAEWTGFRNDREMIIIDGTCDQRVTDEMIDTLERSENAGDKETLRKIKEKEGYCFPCSISKWERTVGDFRAVEYYDNNTDDPQKGADGKPGKNDELHIFVLIDDLPYIFETSDQWDCTLKKATGFGPNNNANQWTEQQATMIHNEFKKALKKLGEIEEVKNYLTFLSQFHFHIRSLQEKLGAKE